MSRVAEALRRASAEPVSADPRFTDTGPGDFPALPRVPEALRVATHLYQPSDGPSSTSQTAQPRSHGAGPQEAGDPPALAVAPPRAPAIDSQSRPAPIPSPIRPSLGRLLVMCAIPGVAVVAGTAVFLSRPPAGQEGPARQPVGQTAVNAGQPRTLGSGRQVAPDVAPHQPDRDSLSSTPAQTRAAPPVRQGDSGRVEVPQRNVDGEAAAPTDATTDAVRHELAASTERWLAAYYAQDIGGMAAISSPDVTVSDLRPASDRLPGGLAGVRRTLASPRVQVFGSAAVLTARVTERAPKPPAGRPAESEWLIAETWTRDAGVWRLHEVRIVSAGALDKAFQR